MANNEKNQCLETKQEEVTLSAVGSSVEEAFTKIFAQLRTELYRKNPVPIVQMETDAVYLEKVESSSKTERFMFLFMPREKREFTVTARISVTVKYLNLEREES